MKIPSPSEVGLVQPKRGPRLVSLEEERIRFWRKVYIPELPSPDDCFIWLKGKDRNGYGRICGSTSGPTVHHLCRLLGENYSHRIAWILSYGSVPDGMCVLHTCDNPACVRPTHLFLGTMTDNNKDMDAKGRRVNPPVNWGNWNNTKRFRVI